MRSNSLTSTRAVQDVSLTYFHLQMMQHTILSPPERHIPLPEADTGAGGSSDVVRGVAALVLLRLLLMSSRSEHILLEILTNAAVEIIQVKLWRHPDYLPPPLLFSSFCSSPLFVLDVASPPTHPLALWSLHHRPAAVLR